jgi:hypothetical protein
VVIVRLINGLGNQMFQYAAGRRLAHALGVPLKLDLAAFAVHKMRSYELGAFSIQETFATVEEVAYLTLREKGFWERLLRRLSHRPTYFIEKRLFHFDPEILTLHPGVYLKGSWQSEKYFKDIEPIIRIEFRLKNLPSDKNGDLLDDITSCDSISLHVRRGDYVSNPDTSRLHGVCNPEYYTAGTSYFAQRIQNPRFFVFSDDPQWVRENLKIPYPAIIVDHNGETRSHEDLRLMSHCKHHIIANSTFSWWGAWLSENPQKIVLAPHCWRKGDKDEARDLIPSSWIKI